MKKALLYFSIIWLAGSGAFAQKTPAHRNEKGFFPIAVWAQNPKNAATYETGAQFTVKKGKQAEVLGETGLSK